MEKVLLPSKDFDEQMINSSSNSSGSNGAPFNNDLINSGGGGVNGSCDNHNNNSCCDNNNGKDDENKESPTLVVNNSPGITTDGTGLVFSNRVVKKTKIRIINKDSDYPQEYTFEEFMKFSNKLVDERSSSIKHNPSSTDLAGLNTIIKVSPNSPIPQQPTTTTTTTSTSTTTANTNNNEQQLECSTTPTTPTLLLNNDSSVLRSPRTTTINQLKSLNSNTFYLNHNPDLITSTNSLLEFSNHQNYPGANTVRNRKIQQQQRGGTKDTSFKPLQEEKEDFLSPSFPSSIPQSYEDDYDDIIKNKKVKENEKIYWIDLEGLSDDEISTVCNLFSIHHLTFEDITSQDSTEKCEEFSNYIFISSSETIYAYTELVQSNIYMVQFASFVLVFHEHPLDSIEDVLNAFRYLENGILTSSQWIVSIFFESFNEIYSELSDQLMKEVNVLDEFTLSEDAAHHSELYVRLGKATRKSTNLLSWIFIKNDILSSLIRLNHIKDDRIHLSNIKDRTVRLKQKIKMAEELLENISNIYISKVSLVLNEESHALNISMRKFSALSVIFMPLNLIAAIYGMNVRLPGEADQEQPEEEVGNYTPFISLMVIIISVGTILALFFKKLDWL